MLGRVKYLHNILALELVEVLQAVLQILDFYFAKTDEYLRSMIRGYVLMIRYTLIPYQRGRRNETTLLRKTD